MDEVPMHASDGHNVVLIPRDTFEELANHPAVGNVDLWQRHVLIAATWKAAQEALGVVFDAPQETPQCGHPLGAGQRCTMHAGHLSPLHLWKNRNAH